MPDLDHHLRTYFDALADQIDDHAEHPQLVELRDGMDVALAAQDVRPIELADERARRRPWAMFAVAAVALALGLAGVLAWNASEEPLSVDVDSADQTTATPQPDPASVESEDGSSAVVIGGERDGVTVSSPDWSGEWQGGTLTLSTVRVLGPPPDDVLERYPPEIQDLWADGLPTTWEQADSEIQAAGLGLLGYETAENDPVLREWFLGATRRPILTHAVDGVVTEIAMDEFRSPVTEIETVASDGERFAVAGAGDGPDWIIAVTEDLETWTTETLIEPTPEGLPAAFVFAPNNDNLDLTVSDWGWALVAEPHLHGIDPGYLVSLGLLTADDEIVSVDIEESILVVQTEDRTLRLSAEDLNVEDHRWILQAGNSGTAPFHSAWAGAWDDTASRFRLVLDEDEVATHAAPNGFYALVDRHVWPREAFSITGDGWYPTSPPPGEEFASAGALGLVSGELVEGGGARFWLSEDLGETWRDVEVLGLEGQTTGLDLWEWPVIRSFYRQEASIDFDEGRVVVTAWFSTGSYGLVSARLENPASGEVLAERDLIDVRFGGEFEFLDESGNVLLRVPASAIDYTDFDQPSQTELSTLHGPSWRMDTTSEPWVAVPIS